MAPKQPKKHNIIPLKPDFDESKLQFVKHKITRDENGVREETEQRVPTLPITATAYQKLMFFEAFSRARLIMGWTTGPKLYSKFVMHLSLVHLRTWTTTVGNHNQTVANFDVDLQAFKSTLLTGYRYHNQMDYLREVKKPRESSPIDFLNLFLSAEQMALELPDTPALQPGFSEAERRRCYYKAMPILLQISMLMAL